MANNPAERRLAAILAADVVGFSALMGSDEAGTLASLKTLRADLVEPKIASHGGRIFKSTGDGFLAEFTSVVNAVACAMAIQQGNKESDGSTRVRMQLRIGINLGDVIVEAEDIFGDGVNVAARLEAIAPPGGIAVSGTVRDHLGNRLDLHYVDSGERSLKNIRQPVRVYEVRQGTGNILSQSPLQLPDKPSIAVLPFENMSSDPEQEFFTDGLTEDIITDLSNAAGLFVIARNSTFSYKGKAKDARQIARDLGVKYVLEGSARRAGQRLRVNVQLIDAAGSGAHIFAERFDRDFTDVFAVQDEVTLRIVEAISGKLHEASVMERYRPTSLEAYELFLKSRNKFSQSRAAAKEAQEELEQAVTLDPNYAAAHCALAVVQAVSWLWWDQPEDPYRNNALASARRAVLLDPNDSTSHANLGMILQNEGRWDEAWHCLETSLRLNKNDAEAVSLYGDFLYCSGKPREGLEAMAYGLRLNPKPPGWYYWDIGAAQTLDHQYDEAVKTLMREETYGTSSRRELAAALALSGCKEEARDEARMFLMDNPNWRIGSWASKKTLRLEKDIQFWADAFRLAGFPD